MVDGGHVDNSCQGDDAAMPCCHFSFSGSGVARLSAAGIAFDMIRQRAARRLRLATIFGAQLRVGATGDGELRRCPQLAIRPSADLAKGAVIDAIRVACKQTRVLTWG
jgi:hypothetical protein